MSRLRRKLEATASDGCCTRSAASATSCADHELPPPPRLAHRRGGGRRGGRVGAAAVRHRPQRAAGRARRRAARIRAGEVALPASQPVRSPAARRATRRALPPNYPTGLVLRLPREPLEGPVGLRAARPQGRACRASSDGRREPSGRERGHRGRRGAARAVLPRRDDRRGMCGCSPRTPPTATARCRPSSRCAGWSGRCPGWPGRSPGSPSAGSPRRGWSASCSPGLRFVPWLGSPRWPSTSPPPATSRRGSRSAATTRCARFAANFNVMLGELERSVQARRQIVADASTSCARRSRCFAPTSSCSRSAAVCRLTSASDCSADRRGSARPARRAGRRHHRRSRGRGRPLDQSRSCGSICSSRTPRSAIVATTSSADRGGGRAVRGGRRRASGCTARSPTCSTTRSSGARPGRRSRCSVRRRGGRRAGPRARASTPDRLPLGVRPLLPRAGGAPAPGNRARAGDRPAGGREPRRNRGGDDRAGRRRAAHASAAGGGRGVARGDPSRV